MKNSGREWAATRLGGVCGCTVRKGGGELANGHLSCRHDWEALWGEETHGFGHVFAGTV